MLVVPPEQPDLQAIREAHQRVRGLVHRTPILTSATIDVWTGGQIFFKCENLQKCGAFKARGAANALAGLPKTALARGVVTHSSGNHGAALAWAAAARGVLATVAMPTNAPRIKRVAVAHYGARIVDCGPSPEERAAAAQAVLDETGGTFVPPYDDARIIAGQGTVALEALEQAGPFDVLLVPLGGGGLLSGCALACAGLAPATAVYGVEPAWADDGYRSLRAGRIEPPLRFDTIADGLRTSLGELTFPILQRHVRGILLVDEAEIVAAQRVLFERLKLVVEPSGAVPLAAVLFGRLDVRGRRVGVVLSGGNVDVTALPFEGPGFDFTDIPAGPYCR